MIVHREVDSGNTDLQDTLAKLECVKHTGPKQWQARCPAHDDQHPSLSISLTDDGQVLCHCHAGCTYQAITDSICLNPPDVPPGSSSRAGAGQIDAAYEYRDEQGNVLFEVVRCSPKRFTQRRPDGNGGHVYKLNGVRRVLYRLPELLGADSSKPAFIVEGEKDVERLVSLGLVATTCPGGAGKWRGDYSNSLAGRHVIVIPDDDDPGHRHAEHVANSLAGIAARIRVLCLPDQAPKGDVSDWLDAGGTKEQLLTLAERAPEWEPYTCQKTERDAGMVARDSSTQWERPIPFGEFELPEFPINAFPEGLSILREMCAAVAESYQVPLDLPAMLALAVGSTALAGRIEVHVHGDHREPLNLYTILALPPAERKSAVFRVMAEPIQTFEREEVKRLTAPVAKNRNQFGVLVVRLKHLQNRAAKAPKEADRDAAKEEAMAVASEIDAFEILVKPRFLADDVTPEKLVTLMHEQGGRIALLSPEGDVFDMMAGRYSKAAAPNLGVYLKAHAGDDIRVDRVNTDRQPEHVARPALTLGLTVQPSLLRGLVDQPGFRGRGLLARFLYSVPRSRLGCRSQVTESVSEHIAGGFRRLVFDAMGTEPHPCDDGPRAHVVAVGPEALQVFREFTAEVERQLGSGGNLEAIQDWAGKLPGAVARIAGIFHGLMHVSPSNLSATTVNAETMEAAIQIGRYLVEHAKAAFFMMGADPNQDRANRIAEWLQREGLERVSRRDVHRAFLSFLGTVGAVDRPLGLLEEHGFIRAVQCGRSGPGRPRSPAYEVNPHWVGQN